MSAKRIPLVAAILLAALTFSYGQSQIPVIVQAMPATPVAATPVAPVPVQSNQSTLKILEEIKTANEVILAKQAATLQQLNELEKAADQIKIYSKRG